jgi:hypothetical protein
MTKADVRSYLRVSSELDDPVMNKALVRKFPFVEPKKWKIKNRGGRIEFVSAERTEYNYEYTMLNTMPASWRRTFGYEMLCDLKKAMRSVSSSLENEIFLYYVREMYGTLQMKFSISCNPVEDVLAKYVEMSKKICYVCGLPASKVVLSNSTSYCLEHLPKGAYCMDLEQYYKEK